MPVLVLMVATDGLPVLQIPPDTPLEVSDVTVPVHRASVPLITPALGNAGSISVFTVVSFPMQLLLVMEKVL